MLLVGGLALVLRGRLRTPDGRVRPRAGALAVALAIVVLASSAPVERWSSRRAEAAADARAIALLGDGGVYAEMMAGLARRNLSDPDPPAWVVTLFASHPPAAHRVGRARSEAGS